jgi:hypothetical protein
VLSDFVVEVVEGGIDFFERVVVWRGRDCETTNMVGRVLAI